jgi:hypothetical protein
MTDNARIESISMWGLILEAAYAGFPTGHRASPTLASHWKPTCVVLQRPHVPRSRSRENYRLCTTGGLGANAQSGISFT